jgi:amino acid adenylation domain-containing protein
MSNVLKASPADLTPEQKRALLARLMRERGGTAQAAEPLVHTLVAARAARTPDAIAVVMDDQSITFRELNARANRLAHRLRALGVGADTLVGLCLERSPELVVGLLGVLKAGGAYVPIDPSYPAARIAFMLEDARVSVLLTQQDLREDLPQSGARVVCLDSDWEDIENERSEDPERGARGANLAYVIYTSGSTGRPKGVQVTHAALANFLMSMAQVLGPSAQDTLLAVTTLSFDIAGLELYLPLIQGGTVRLASRGDAQDAARLRALLDDPAVTYLQATPATWRMLLDAGWPGRKRLTLLCGGEALPRDLADRLLDKGDGLWNLYGPTETTIWSSAAKVEPGDGPVPIGRPIANTRMYVLDARLRPVPVGVTGELYIGGAGLARGYLDRAGLTAERFLPDPVGPTPGSRIYRTGDLARWRNDGALECLGRFDHQVKIRGFRIELGEIETALRKHDSVREAVVVARPDSAGELTLVGYIVADPAPSPAELRGLLFETLPDYMVPTAFVALNELPLMPNGKIDRKALPDPDQARLTGETPYVAPRGPVEEGLAEIWAEVLGRERVGVEDNFFDLGGHSLMAAQVLARLRDTFGVELPLRDLFENLTVAGQARRIEDALRAESSVQAPPLTRADRPERIPASFAQQRLWFLDQLEPGSVAYNMPAAVRLVGALDVPALERALNEIVRRHEGLRTTFGSEDGVPFQVLAPELTVRLPLTDLTGRSAGEREAEAMGWVEREVRRPFDLARGPLLRAALLRLGEEEHIVAVTMHHIISDAWSIGVLIRETAALYDAFAHESPAPLPELPLQYADYAIWQRGWLQGDVLQAQLDYWAERLTGVPVLELPADRPRVAAPLRRGGMRSAVLPKELLAGARELGRKEGATLFMTLMAAFQAFLHRYSGQDDFAVGTPIAGRTRSEVEPLIGFFVNTLVLRADLSGEPTFRTLVRRVRQAALGAYAHQDLPFERLVVALHPERTSTHTPLFQVMFVVQNAPMPPLESPDMKVEPLEPDLGAAKFDLMLVLEEKAEALHATFDYDTDLFETATIDRMLGHLRTLLEELVAHPDQSVATLTMMSEEERRMLVGGWPDGAANGQAAPEDLDLDGLSEDELDALLSHYSPTDDSTNS